MYSGDPQTEIAYDGATYYLIQTAGGHYLKNCKGPGQEMLSWSYEDDSGSKYLTIEQWGEEDFQASVGIAVEPYQFTNILPWASGREWNSKLDNGNLLLAAGCWILDIWYLKLETGDWSIAEKIVTIPTDLWVSIGYAGSN